MDVTGLIQSLVPVQDSSVGTYLHHLVLLYLGPETIMPITSVLAAAVGVVLIFWRHVTATIRMGFRRLFVRKQAYNDSTGNLDSPD